MTRRTAAGLAALALLAAGLRIAAIGFTHATSAPAEENRLIARNLAAGRGFTFTEFGVTGPTAVRGPGYPMLLAVAGPDRVRLILFVNVVGGAGSVLAAYALAAALSSPPPPGGGGGGRGDGDVATVDARSAAVTPPPKPLPQGEGEKITAPWIAATLFAVWPTQVYAATLTQGLSIAVMLTLIALAIAWRRTPPAALVGGLLAGMAALTEPVLALALGLATIALVARASRPCFDSAEHGRDACATKSIVLFLAGAAVLVTPWLYRNAIVFGRPMPITSNVWRDAFLGNGPNETAGQVDWTRDNHRQVRGRIDLLKARDYDRLKVPEPRRTEVFREWAVGWIAAHPGRYVLDCVGRCVETFVGTIHHVMADRGAYIFSRAFAAGGLALWVLSGTKAAWPWLGTTLLLAGGLILASAFTNVDARTAVLMDVPQLLILAFVGAGIPKQAAV